MFASISPSMKKTALALPASIGDFKVLLKSSLVVGLGAFGTPWFFGISYTATWI